MKKVLILLVAFAFMCCMTAPVMAGDLPASVDKLAHGTMDIITSPVELYDHTIGDDKGDDAMGFLMGLLTSPFHMLKKAGTGVIDVVTFPVE